ncbi:MAG: (2Fe-2S) ferredoxin domain-containing protein [Firmicutes bacterium]|nr:(2Fe-2S) ferredoxin domain-containing protein [Bacillota bacterium]
MKMTIDMLNEIRDKYKDSVTIRKHADGTKVIVAMGTCGIAAGAREVLKTFVEEIHGVNDITVGQSGCVGDCANEPIVRVVTPGKDTVTYIKVTPEKAKRIAAEHVLGGKPIAEYQA